MIGSVQIKDKIFIIQLQQYQEEVASVTLFDKIAIADLVH